MNDNYEVSMDRINEAIPKKWITDELVKLVKNSGARFSQIIINHEDGKNVFYLTSVKDFYIANDNSLKQFSKSDVESVKFVKPVPHGEVIIKLKNGEKFHLKDIIAGRAFDYIQDVKPRTITLAGYDNTIRGEFPQLLDPDHAEENDRLRRWMQDGHISHYQYDDANPAYPKAGK